MSAMHKRDRRKLGVYGLVVSAVVAATVFVSAPAANAQAAGCAPGTSDDYTDQGPFQVAVENAAAHTYYSPTQLGGQGCTSHPVIIWGNGIFTTPTVYDGLLRHFASWGFVVAAANSSFPNGSEMVDGLDNLEQLNSQPGHRFNGMLDLERVGSTGHSMGGGGAINAAADPRVDTTFPLQPLFSGNERGVHGTAFYMTGTADTVIPPATVRTKFDNSSGIPAAFGNLDGAHHLVPLGNAGDFKGPATAWARWQLAGDANASSWFLGADCGMCTAPQWDYEANSNLQGSEPPPPTDPTVPGDPTEPPAEECSWLGRLFGWCGGDGGTTPTTQPPAEQCSWLGRLFGLCE